MRPLARFFVGFLLASGAVGPVAHGSLARAAPRDADGFTQVMSSSLLVLRAAADASGVYAYVLDGDPGTRSLLRRRPDGALEVLARSPQIEQLALDGERVYWVGEDGVQAVAKAGGPVLSLAGRDWTLIPHATEPSRWALAVAGDDVFFSLDDGIGRVPKAGGDAQLLAEVPNGRGATVVGVDDDEVWWVEHVPPDGEEPPSADVFATPRGGGAARRVLHGLTALRGIVVDEEGIYWLGGTEGRGAIHRASKSTGDVVTLAVDVPVYYDRALAVAGASLFWLDYPNGLHGPMRVRAMPKSGGAAPETLAEPFPTANKLLLDEGHVYWAQQGVEAVASPLARAVLRGSAIER
ncbi:MAG TPA: hypothetical protein VGL81_09825 [Polyangiaceae bacterium]|jgi:hypothetical protein